MLKNIFSQGVNPGSAKLKDKVVFPYEQDKRQQLIRAFTVKKTFDSDRKRWKDQKQIDDE